MSAWMPDAARVAGFRDAGAMESRAVLWCDAGLGDDYSAALAAQYANAHVRASHLIYDASTDVVVQMLPADRRAMWVNSEGIQILVCGVPPEGRFPLKGQAVDSLSGLSGVLGWVRSLDVPDFSPRGPAVAGHPIGAGKAPGHYSSEGKIDVSRLLA